MSTYVLDSSAILCFLRNEPGADIVDALLTDTANQHVIHAVNWTEVRYLERRGQLPKDKSLQEFTSQVDISISNELSPAFREGVALLKAEYPPIALGDCFAVALAQALDATLVTTDRSELEKLAVEGICKILFLR